MHMANALAGYGTALAGYGMALAGYGTALVGYGMALVGIEAGWIISHHVSTNGCINHSSPLGGHHF